MEAVGSSETLTYCQSTTVKDPHTNTTYILITMNTLNPTGKSKYILEIFRHNYDYQEQYSLKSKN
jgi:hypothetical protein